ncbi:phosphonate ABC transporter, permease protein PhnE, partial [Pantoea allii]
MISHVPDVALLKQQHRELFAAQPRYLRRIGLMTLAVLLYYLFFFSVFGLEWSRLLMGCQQLGRYFLRMFVWHDFVNWLFGYYFSQVGITLGIVFAGTLTASLLALPLSFLAARNVMHDRATKPVAFLMRRVFDVLRGIDMA